MMVLSPMTTTNDLSIITVSEFNGSTPNTHYNSIASVKYTVIAGEKLSSGTLVPADKVMVATPDTGFPIYYGLVAGDVSSSGSFKFVTLKEYTSDTRIISLPSSDLSGTITKSASKVTYTYTGSSAAADPVPSIAAGTPVVFRNGVVDSNETDIVPNKVYYVCGAVIGAKTLSGNTRTTAAPLFSTVVGKRQCEFYIKTDRTATSTGIV